MSDQKILDGEACNLGAAVVLLFSKYPTEDRMGLLAEWCRAASDAIAETVISEGPYACG